MVSHIWNFLARKCIRCICWGNITYTPKTRMKGHRKVREGREIVFELLASRVLKTNDGSASQITNFIPNRG